MSDECCANCRFWVNFGLEVDDEDQGECCRYAPRPHQDLDGGSEGLRTVWPVTLAIHWCGEYEPHESNDEEEDDPEFN